MTIQRQLPLHELHLALGASLTGFAGWLMPVWYASAVAEHKAVRDSCGVFDISHLSRFWVCGPATAAALASFCTRDPTSLEVGGSQYALVCDEEGGIIEDLLIYRFGEEQFLVIGNATNAQLLRGLVETACAGREASLEDAAPETALLAVQGVRAPEILAGILRQPVQDVARHRCAEIGTDRTRYFLSRTGYTGEDGFEVMTSVETAKALFQELTSAGCPPCGLAARDSLRLEAALPLYGFDIDTSTLPWEAGLGWAVELGHDFPGRAALLATKDSLRRTLTCLVSDGEGVFRHGYPVYHQEQKVGTVTSGGFSPTLGTSIALAYLPPSLAGEGTSLTVGVRSKVVPCHTVKRPFYRPGRGTE